MLRFTNLTKGAFTRNIDQISRQAHRSIQMQTAYKFIPGNPSLVKSEIPVPTANYGEVILEIQAAGMCHSDIHVLDGEIPLPNSFVMGHEIAGTIHEVGEGVKGHYHKGDLYAVHGPNPCGHCKLCRLGLNNDCVSEDRTWYGLGYDGGYQKYIRIPNPETIVKVPDGISAAVAAVTSDAVLTPYRALKQAGVTAASKVLIIGLGGLGLNAVQLAKALGAYVIATDQKQSARDFASEFGADQILGSLPEAPLGVDAVLDIVGRQATFDSAQKHVRSGGIIVPVGLQDSKISFDLNDLALREVRVQGTFWGTITDLEESLDIVSRGLIKPQVQTLPLDKLPESIEQLTKGQVKNRIAFIP